MYFILVTTYQAGREHTDDCKLTISISVDEYLDGE